MNAFQQPVSKADPSRSSRPAGRFTTRRERARWVQRALASSVAASAPASGALGGALAQEAPDPETVLKQFVVKGDNKVRPLPKIALQPSLATNDEDVTLRSVIRRDLDLCGEFEVLPDSAAPDKLYLSDTPVDVKAWRAKGAEAVVKVSGTKRPDGKVQLNGVAYFVSAGAKPVFDKSIVVDASRVRAESHRVADALIGALTGTPGGFSSQMTFIYGAGKARRAYTMDADGHDPRAVSSDDQLALAPAFGPKQRLYYAASVKKDAFRVFSPGSSTPLTLPVRGSVYGIAFSRHRDRVALAIARGAGIQLFTGPNFTDLTRMGNNNMVLHPAFTPSGKVAYSGEGKWGQRVFVAGKAISPAGVHASAPTFCRHPDGVRAVYAVGVGKNTDLVASTETGGSMVRLTQNMGRNNYPACSPDGRLVAFFSTRTRGQGPGLYIMRIDGTRPKRISTLVGDSLRWAPLPTTNQPAAKARAASH